MSACKDGKGGTEVLCALSRLNLESQNSMEPKWCMEKLGSSRDHRSPSIFCLHGQALAFFFLLVAVT